MSVNLLELERLKTYLGITTTEDDDILTDCLNSAWSYMERYTGRQLGNGNYTEVKFYDGNQRHIVVLDNPPILSVAELKINDFVLSSDDYTIDKNSGLIYLNVAVEMKKSEVSYNGGYYALSSQNDPKIPLDLYMAGIKLAAIEYLKARGRLGVRSIQGAGENLTVYEELDLNLINTTLDLYRRIKI